MEIFIWSLISIMGLCFGSFLNVLIHRSQTGESILYPPSKCPRCDVPLLWWQNIPLFSYFYLNGRCYYCNKIISIQYPIVEFLGLILFIFSFSIYKSIFDAICVIGIVSILFVQSILDVRIKKISSTHCIIAIILGIIFNRYDLINSISGMLIGGLIIFLIKKLGEKFLGKEVFGSGDIYLFGSLGSLVCGDKILLYMLYTFIIQLLIYLPFKWKELKQVGNYSLTKYLKVFAIVCIMMYLMKTKDFLGETIIYLFFMLILIYSAYQIVKNIYNSLKTEQNPQYCALAPAILIASILFLL